MKSKLLKRVLLVIGVSFMGFAVPAGVIYTIATGYERLQLSKIDKDLIEVYEYVINERIGLYEENAGLAIMKETLKEFEKKYKLSNVPYQQLAARKYAFNLRMYLWCEIRAWFPKQIANIPKVRDLAAAKLILGKYKTTDAKYKFIDEVCFALQERQPIRVLNKPRLIISMHRVMPYSKKYIGIMKNVINFGKGGL